MADARLVTLDGDPVLTTACPLCDQPVVDLRRHYVYCHNATITEHSYDEDTAFPEDGCVHYNDSYGFCLLPERAHG